MSHKAYIDAVTDIDQIDFIIEAANRRRDVLTAGRKQKRWCVSINGIHRVVSVDHSKCIKWVAEFFNELAQADCDMLDPWSFEFNIEEESFWEYELDEMEKPGYFEGPQKRARHYLINSKKK